MLNIAGFEGKYSITKDGDVFSHVNDKWLVKSHDRDGYFRVTLTRNGRDDQVSFRVARLVAETYLDNPENKPCVNHINGCKTDDRIENLEWVTHQENTKHAWDTGLCNPYDRSKPYNREAIIASNKRRRKYNPSEEDINKIFSLREKGLSQTKIGEEVGIEQATISKILRGCFKYDCGV